MDYLTKIKPYINHRPFKCSFGIYVFDTKYQIDHIGPQPVQLRLLYNQYNFKFSVAVADVISHALVLTRKLINDERDGNKMVDIVSLRHGRRTIMPKTTRLRR